MNDLREMYNVSVIAMEYPGYGAFKHRIEKGAPTKYRESCSAKKIKVCADIVYKNIIAPTTEGGMGYSENDVIVFGRSMGTGPACYLAAKYNPGYLLLMSPYISIKKVAQDIVGNFLGNLVATHFNNFEQVKNINCPVFIVHGVKDELIRYKHAEELHDEFQKHEISAFFVFQSRSRKSQVRDAPRRNPLQKNRRKSVQSQSRRRNHLSNAI